MSKSEALGSGAVARRATGTGMQRSIPAQTHRDHLCTPHAPSFHAHLGARAGPRRLLSPILGPPCQASVPAARLAASADRSDASLSFAALRGPGKGHAPPSRARWIPLRGRQSPSVCASTEWYRALNMSDARAQGGTPPSCPSVPLREERRRCAAALLASDRSACGVSPPSDAKLLVGRMEGGRVRDDMGWVIETDNPQHP